MITKLSTLTILIICSLHLTQCFHNPGIIIQIPTNYSLPIVKPQLPQPIPSILLQNLELSSISLREIQYSWRYQGDKFVILLQRTVVSFDWKYGKDKGIGTFVEEYSDLIVQCSFDVTKDMRFKVDIQSAKITNQDKRHSIKINLGGNVPETIVIEVTNLILNHAKAAFRSAIKNVVAKVVQTFTEPLRKDFKVYCKNQSQNKQQCIYINTTLVGKPIISDNIQIIQVNGAPYKLGHSSGFLDPKDAMFKIASAQINIQIHQQFFSQFLLLFNQISPISQTINSTQISSVVDIDSQTLSVVFPKMRDYDPRPVLFRINIEQIKTLLNDPPFIGFLVNITIRVQTQKLNVFEPYIKKIGGLAIVKLQPIINGYNIGARIHKIVLDKVDVEAEDIKASLIKPQQVMKHIETLMKWTQSGVNGGLNEKKYQLQFATVKVHPKVTVLTKSINLQTIFVEQTKRSQINHKSGSQFDIYVDL